MTATKSLVLLVAFLLAVVCLQGCASYRVVSYVNETPSGGASYPGELYRFGSFAFYRLYSILPGEARIECRPDVHEFSRASVTLEINDCAGAGHGALLMVGSAVMDMVSDLREASGGQFELCSITLVLVAENAGISSRDTQRVGANCPRLRLLVRWHRDDSSGSLRSILRTIGHEGYHLTLARQRRGAREVSRWQEEVEAEIAGACSEKTALGTLDTVVRLAGFRENGVQLGDSVRGQREAARLLASGRIVNFVPWSRTAVARTLMAGCVRILSGSAAAGPNGTR